MDNIIGSHSGQDRQRKRGTGMAGEDIAWSFSLRHLQMRTHQLENIWISWGFWRGSVGGGVTVIDCWGEPMGAKLTVCCCQHCLRHNREEKNAILRWDHHLTDRMTTELIYWNQLDECQNHNILLLNKNIPSYSFSSMRSSPASRQPEVLSSDSSDSDTDGESLFRPQCSRSKSSQAATISRPCESPVRRGLDRELQAFISMRDQTDEATEVRLCAIVDDWSNNVYMCTQSQNQQHITTLQSLFACHLT